MLIPPRLKRLVGGGLLHSTDINAVT